MAPVLSVRDPESLTKHEDDGTRRLVPIGGFGWVAAMLSWGLTYRVVPPEFWIADMSDDGSASVATVSCPCGHAPAVEVARAPTACECERWFFFTGTEVWSFCGPSRDSSPPERVADGVN